MDDQLRAMALSLAVEWSKGTAGMSPEEVVEAAKKFVQYIEGAGISTVAPNLGDFLRGGH